mgnify:FL=1
MQKLKKVVCGSVAMVEREGTAPAGVPRPTAGLGRHESQLACALHVPSTLAWTRPPPTLSLIHI